MIKIKALTMLGYDENEKAIFDIFGYISNMEFFR